MSLPYLSLSSCPLLCFSSPHSRPLPVSEIVPLCFLNCLLSHYPIPLPPFPLLASSPVSRPLQVLFIVLAAFTLPSLLSHSSFPLSFPLFPVTFLFPNFLCSLFLRLKLPPLLFYPSLFSPSYSVSPFFSLPCPLHIPLFPSSQPSLSALETLSFPPLPFLFTLTILSALLDAVFLFLYFSP